MGMIDLSISIFFAVCKILNSALTLTELEGTAEQSFIAGGPTFRGWPRTIWVCSL